MREVRHIKRKRMSQETLCIRERDRVRNSTMKLFIVKQPELSCNLFNITFKIIIVRRECVFKDYISSK